MQSDKGEGLPAKAAGELAEEGVLEPVLVERGGHWERVWRITKRGLLIILGLALVAAAVLWVERKPIANNVLANELARRGVQASYHLDRIGLRTQQVSNLVIGDPANPDLTARVAQVQMRVLLNGRVEVFRIYARGVRLHGRVIGRKVSWGQIDKLLPPPTPGKPFRLPDITVDVADTAVRLDTPYGRLGFALAGVGNLSGGFKGRMAVAGHALRPGHCALDELHANLAVHVEARHPHVTGPVAAANFACPVSNLALIQPRLEIDSDFTEGFDRFDGSGKVSLASMRAGANGIANATGEISFKGTPTLANGRIRLAAQQARLAQILADRTRIDGTYRLGGAAGTLDLAADYAATRVALDRRLTQSAVDPLLGAAKTPIGPIAVAMGRAIGRFASNFDVSGRLALVNRPGDGGVRIRTADAFGPGGSEVHVAGGDGVTYYWPSGRIRVDSNIATRGGGLPDARIALHQPRGGGPLNGTADIAPYRVGDSRLALAPVRFVGLADGGTHVSTIALLDGRFPDGMVRGLRVPVEGRFGGRGGLRIGEGCVDARFATLQYGALRLGPTRLPLCPVGGGAILTQAPGGSLRIGAETRNLRLAGTLGKSPFGLAAARARLAGDRAFEAAAIEMRLGKSAAPVVIDAGRLSGTFAGRGISGRFAQGKAIVGNVPLLLSNADGRWTYYHSALTVDGAMDVSDRADPSRFYPLHSNNVHMTLAGDWIRATGRLDHPATGTPITDVTIAHRLSTGAGDATLDVPGIRFTPTGLQPTDITRLAEGIIALVNGRLNGQGHIHWAGGGDVTSTGTFNIVNTDLAAPFGPVTGLNTTINFTNLLNLETGSGQSATVASINPGILVENGVVHYQFLPGKLVKIERGEWPFMGGTLVLQETILNFAKNSPKRLTFEVHGLDAHTFVASLGFAGIDATGTFDGVLPMIFDETGGRIVGGRLDSRAPGGELQYSGTINRANLGLMAKFAFDALRDLKFKSMIIRLDGALDGEFATRLTIEGVGLGESGSAKLLRSITRKLPLKFNVTIKGPFRALIATAKSFRDPRTVISDVLPVPLQDIPGIVTEVRQSEERKEQTQTPPGQPTIEPAPTPAQ